MITESCQHGIPLFQSCSSCGREMVKSPLTSQFISTLKPAKLMFEKPIPRKKKTMADYAKRAKKCIIAAIGARKRKVKPSTHRKKLPKTKTRWQLIKILDGMVSNFVLVKVCKGKCMRCGKQHFQHINSKGELKWDNYGCSHYWARDYMGSRFEVDNLDGLCWQPCHGQKWEHDKNGAYKDYMLKKLGQKKYKLLELRARAISKFSTQDIKFMIDNFDTIWKL